eukprot:1213302-Amphidinium_carterae.1
MSRTGLFSPLGKIKNKDSSALQENLERKRVLPHPDFNRTCPGQDVSALSRKITTFDYIRTSTELDISRILEPHKRKEWRKEGSTTSGLQMNMPTFCCWSRGRFYYIKTSTGYVKVLLLERKKFLLDHDLSWTYQACD